jgi:small redox-active disulfide protein 2
MMEANDGNAAMRNVQIFGTGCAKCRQLAANVRTAVVELDIQCEAHEVKDLDEILKAGVMLTPALAIDGQVKAVGRVPSVEEIKRMLG